MKPFQPIFKHSFVLLVFVFLFASAQFAQDSSVLKSNVEAAEFYGKLDSELTPDLHELYGVVFKPVGDVIKYKFARPLENEAVVSVGSLLDRRNKTAGGKFEILLVEPKNGNPYFYADFNASGTFEETERFLPAAAKESANDYDLLLKLPVTSAFYQSFPVFLRFKRGFKHPNLKADERLVFQSYTAYAGGAVSINNKTVRVQYPFDPAESAISTTDGLFGIDTNGDGLIRDEPFSPETSYATKDEIVFRFGEMYLSTRSIELAVNKITMRVRQKSEISARRTRNGQRDDGFFIR